MVRLHNPLVILAVIAEVAIEDLGLVVVALNEFHMVKSTENLDVAIPNGLERNYIRKYLYKNVFFRKIKLKRSFIKQ